MTRLLSTICFTIAAYCARRAQANAYIARLYQEADWPEPDNDEMIALYRAREQLWDRRMKRLLVWGGIREEVLRER